MAFISEAGINRQSKREHRIVNYDNIGRNQRIEISIVLLDAFATTTIATTSPIAKKNAPQLKC